MSQTPSLGEAEKAFASGAVFECSDDKLLQKYLNALCWSRFENETVRHRVIIEGITLGQLLMKNFIRRVDRQNRILTIVVIVLAGISIGSQVLAWTFPREMTRPTGQASARYDIKNIQETAHTDGKLVQTVYKVDASTGRTWRLESSPLVDANNKVLTWADGWEPIADSTEEALKRTKAKWEESAKWQATRPESQR